MIKQDIFKKKNIKETKINDLVITKEITVTYKPNETDYILKEINS